MGAKAIVSVLLGLGIVISLTGMMWNWVKTGRGTSPLYNRSSGLASRI